MPSPELYLQPPEKAVPSTETAFLAQQHYEQGVNALATKLPEVEQNRELITQAGSELIGEFGIHGSVLMYA